MDSKQLGRLLDAKHKLFADKYLSTGHISNSAKSVGYSGRSAHVSGNRLLKRPDVQRYLAARYEELSSQEESLQQRVVKELETMAFANIADFITIDSDGKPQVDFSGATPEQLRAITALKTKSRSIYNKDGDLVATEDTADFAMADKYRGLELLGKHLGLFKAEEQRVVFDVADRLLRARQRALQLTNRAAESVSD